MRFTTTISMDACRRRLFSHESVVPVLADTEVLFQRLPDNRTQFAVRRVWKSVEVLLRYPVLQATGVLAPIGSKQTDVTVHLEIRELGLAQLGLILLFLLLAFSNPTVVSAWLIVISLFALLAYDCYAVYRVIRDLRS
jgi:hypothetical protein